MEFVNSADSRLRLWCLPHFYTVLMTKITLLILVLNSLVLQENTECWTALSEFCLLRYFINYD